jgi:hypothetical protein
MFHRISLQQSGSNNLPARTQCTQHQNNQEQVENHAGTEQRVDE